MRWILMVPAGLLILGLLVIPSLGLLLQSLSPSGETGVSLANFEALYDSRSARQAFWRTIEVSLWVTLLSILAGYPLALAITRASRGMRAVLLAIIVFPFMLSAVVRAYGWTVVLGDRGLINEALVSLGLIDAPIRMMHTSFAIVMGETHLLMPYMVLSLLAVLRGIDPNLFDAAKSLGANPASVFWRILMPMTLPGLLTGTLLVFSLAMTAFATPILLGGTRSPVLTVLLYRYAFTLFDWPKAAAVAAILLAMGGAFLILYRVASRRLLQGAAGPAP
ncbi:MAG: ABC transporter permease [Pseudomonadota bacterium]